ncbi:hypothetical protein CONPUDRAFT_73861 [Coniophora puteana RWD-64-598 SS2]|uniref:Uncharacterized protein n=1 Tax=Coniophora puteana (strain RWD-64-598) TaxID=741705 RepID=A0A5M3MQQ1_CONPW|nr:uncharacterized protein CONPUDRAFT_73861 [Coniophora puteana RWD-64-598 SS2]EIW80841.1 hypothetical protein CONPUDRAFT_73861 [Coniophora puteana RWD-64-598 SS2]
MSYMNRLKTASFDDPTAKLSQERHDRLQNPPAEPEAIDNPGVKMGIMTYLGAEHSSQETYKAVRKGVETCYPDASPMPTFKHTESIIEEYTGVSPIKYNMCWGSCVTFTGDLEHADACPECHKSRYDPFLFETTGEKRARMFKINPPEYMIQALFRNKESPKNL